MAEAEPRLQAWAAAMIEVLRAGRKSVTGAVAAGRSALTGQEIEQIRAAYREQAQAGITANLGRRTSKGDKHPAWVLAQRLYDKIDLVLHHLTDFTVPWTSNLAEQALRHAKIHLKISGCFRSLETTRAYCRIHSYLITIRLNAVPPMQAIRDALADTPGHPCERSQLLSREPAGMNSFMELSRSRLRKSAWPTVMRSVSCSSALGSGMRRTDMLVIMPRDMHWYRQRGRTACSMSSLAATTAGSSACPCVSTISRLSPKTVGSHLWVGDSDS